MPLKCSSEERTHCIETRILEPHQKKITSLKTNIDNKQEINRVGASKNAIEER